MAPSSSHSLPSSPVRSSPFRKRLQTPVRDVVPLLALGRDGTIRSTTRAANQLLEYSSDASLGDSFFAHVHPKHRRRVMRDLADMVSRGKRQAQWLLRLRTGNERWRWYRASVHNHLADDTERMLVRLRPM